MAVELNRRVLVIDDHEAVRQDFAKVLGAGEAAPAASSARSAFLGAAKAKSSLPVFELELASQGEEGVEKARAACEAGRPYAVAFVDVRMPPGMDGVQTIARLWELQPDLQVVICTAFADYSFEEIIEKLGSSHGLLILKKPFEPVEVRQLASALTEKWNAMRRERETLDALSAAELEARELAIAQAEANRALEEANFRAEGASRAKAEFLANMSHEIRTPMGALLGFVELLLDSIDPTPEQQEQARAIRAGGAHLLDIVNDILDLSRIEGGELVLEPTDFSPAELIGRVHEVLAPSASAKGIALALEVDPSVPEQVRSDPRCVRQVLLNLVGNAVKFTRQGSVRTRVTVPQGEGGTRALAFSIADTGPGIPADRVDSLFDAFTQLDSSTTRHAGGTGLGLAICERLSAALGGRIEVQSEEGRGSTFTFVLDVAAGSPPAPRVLEDGGEGPVAARVLLVEDVPVNQVLISSFLRKAGCEVEVAANGEAGCQRFLAARGAGEPFDLVLMDMQMPVMDGYEATRALRAAGVTTPIVALTAHAMAQDRERCLAAGCTDHLTKPVERKLLVARVRQVLEEAVPAPLPAPRAPADAPLGSARDRQ